MWKLDFKTVTGAWHEVLVAPRNTGRGERGLIWWKMGNSLTLRPQLRGHLPAGRRYGPFV